MSSGNAIVDALEALEAEVKRLGTAVKSADPAALQKAAQTGAATAATEVRNALSGFSTSVTAIQTATSDAKEAAEAARQAAADAVQARKGVLVSWGPGAALGALLCLLAGVGGYWYGQQSANGVAGPDAAWARQFNANQREIAMATVRAISGRSGWFTSAKDIEAQVEAATAVTPDVLAWANSQQARTLRRIGELAPDKPAEGAPWPCFGWGQQTWTLGNQSVTTCVVRWK